MDIRSCTPIRNLLDDLSKVIDAQWQILGELYQLETKEEFSTHSGDILKKFKDFQNKSGKILGSLLRFTDKKFKSEIGPMH